MMTLEPTVKRVSGFGRVLGTGFVLYGKAPMANDVWKWFERRFPTAEAAKRYAAKRGWNVQEKSVEV